MNLKQCDGGCGKISPVDGLHIANHWLTIDVSCASFKERSPRTYHLCEECSAGDGPKPELKMLGKISAHVMGWFFGRDKGATR